MIVKGTVHKYGDNVDTDVIIPARYLNVSDPKELAGHCMEDIDAEFTKNVKDGDIIVGRKNFGCGSSREHAPLAIKYSGVSLVVADSFARIFYRNAINTGLAIVESREAASDAKSGDVMEADLSAGILKNVTQNKTYQVQPFPEFIQKIIDCGGLMTYLKENE